MFDFYLKFSLFQIVFVKKQFFCSQNKNEINVLTKSKSAALKLPARPVAQMLLAHETLLFVWVVRGPVEPLVVSFLPVELELAPLGSSGVPHPKAVPRFDEWLESLPK